jgi:hypothetical protein
MFLLHLSLWKFLSGTPMQWIPQSWSLLIFIVRTSQNWIRSVSLWRWYIYTYIDFLDIIQRSAMGFIKRLTEMSTRNIKMIIFLGSKVRSVRRADNLTSICKPIVYDNVGSLTSHSPIGLQSLLWGIALLYRDGMCFLWGTNWTVSTATSSQYLAVNCEPTV